MERDIWLMSHEELDGLEYTVLRAALSQDENLEWHDHHTVTAG